jgi:phenylacetyl-CoA:acceptor oxidoreductase subunit 2
VRALRRTARKSAAPVGPEPRLQQTWDWCAACNFTLGGAGSGLLAFTLLAQTQDTTAAVLLVVALALVGGGLLCVWLEIGRPRRFVNVFLNPRRSWMSREAMAAVALFPVTLAVAFGVGAARVPAVVLALAFLYCQSRIVQRARAIPAWREPLVVPLIVATGLAEGAGLFFVAAPRLGEGSNAPALALGSLVLVRYAAWHFYRRRLTRTTAPAALAALDRAGVYLRYAGTLAPLLFVAALATGAATGVTAAVAAALAGALAAAAGLRLKWVLVRRAAFHQGFTLPHWPVRGAAR